MSIKRSKRPTSGSRRDENDSAFGFVERRAAEPEKSWDEHMAGKPDEAFVPYSLKSRFASGTLLAHPKFGKGVVLSVEGSHIEVLFAEGKKKLGHAMA
jgi:hypothetical protein